MRQCYIDNGRRGCDGQRNNKGRIRYGCVPVAGCGRR